MAVNVIVPVTSTHMGDNHKGKLGMEILPSGVLDNRSNDANAQITANLLLARVALDDRSLVTSFIADVTPAHYARNTAI